MSEELRERMAKLAIEDLREATDNLYVYNFLKDMANIVIADEGFRVHTDQYGDTVWIDENEYYGDHDEESELDRLSGALADLVNPPQEDEDVEEDAELRDLEEKLRNLELRLFSDILGKDIKITVTDAEPRNKTETEELEERIRTNLKKSLEEKYDIGDL